jgi:hypothetical protein
MSDITTEIAPLTAADKKIILNFLWLMYKLFCGLLFVLFILMCFIADWKTKDMQTLIFIGWLPSALLVQFMFFVWYLFVKKQFKYPYKMVISGIVMDKFVHNGKYPEFNVFLGKKQEEFKLMKAYDWPDKTIEINDSVALHYVLKAKDKLGSLIKVVKLNP